MKRWSEQSWGHLLPTSAQRNTPEHTLHNHRAVTTSSLVLIVISVYIGWTNLMLEKRDNRRTYLPRSSCRKTCVRDIPLRVLVVTLSFTIAVAPWQPWDGHSIPTSTMHHATTQVHVFELQNHSANRNSKLSDNQRMGTLSGGQSKWSNKRHYRCSH